jgi:hypothetical protein
MESERSSFLVGGLEWIYGGTVPDRCGGCGFDWGQTSGPALDLIVAAPTRYTALLDGRDGMAPAADGGWNATAYVWHLVDLARSWSERWVQVRDAPGSLLAGWDPDVLAEARNYRQLPTSAALWFLQRDVATFVALCHDIDHATRFEHGEWGSGTVADAIVWLAHEFTHHQLDVDERAV